MNTANEQRLQVRLPLLLPEIDGVKDQCIDRLTEKLLANRGVSRAHVDEEGSEAVLCMHYDPEVMPLKRLEQIAKTTGAGITKRYRHENMRLLGMGCTDCAASIEHIVGRAEGVVHVSVNYAAERMRVEYDTSRISGEKIVSRIRGMGYDVMTRAREGWLSDHWDLVLSLLSGLFLSIGFGGGLSGLLPWPAQLAAYIVSYLAGGFDATRHGIRAALHLRFDIDFLMVVAAVGAAAINQWPEGALLLFLFSLGHALEHSALGKARRSIDRLGELAPDHALVRRDGKELQIPVDELLRGDMVIVRPGERIPIDGVVSSGRSDVDESTITGESMPKDKSPGQPVYAGTVNGDGALLIEVSKLATETMLSRIITLVEDAQTQKAPTERLVDRFERYFVPVVLIGVVLIAVVPAVTGLLSFRAAFLRAITVLVAASPCALAIATPAAILSGIARAARGGVLVKGGLYLETLGRIRSAAFDKTGTITQGKPALRETVCAEGVSEEQLLTACAAAESQSKHPLALALLAEVERRGIEVPSVEAARAEGGRGVTAEIGGKRLDVGSRTYIAELGIRVPEQIAAAADRLADAGQTIVLVAQEETVLGALAFADATREGAADALKELGSLGVRNLALITGDNPRVAGAIGREVGIGDVRAELLPDDKVKAIEEMVAAHGPTAMIGDGVNDAPAMARASVGVAMGAHGSDVAMETADVALMSDDLRMLPFAIGLSRSARLIVVENLAVALGVIALLLASAVSGVVNIGIAIAVHEGSTLLVVMNALRLLGYHYKRARRRTGGRPAWSG